MAKFNIFFKGTNYSIEASDMNAALVELRNHLQNSMNGSGAVINLNGNSYNVDSEKLTIEKNKFATHLSAMPGNGPKVVVGGVEYQVDSAKTSAAVAELRATLDNLSGNPGGSDEPVAPTRAAGLYETGTDTMITSWDDLLAEGVVHVDNGVMYTNFDMNEWYNPCSEALTGDLVILNDGSITTLGDGIFDEDGNPQGNFAFMMCDQLTEVIIPDSVTSIGEAAFSGCSSLKSITIPESVASIGACAFGDCISLTSIIVEEGNSVYHSEGDCLIEATSKTLIVGCQNSIIPSDGSVTSIGDSAFSGCSSLTSITIPDSVTSIGVAAFCFCENLTSVTIPSSVTNIGDEAFSDCVNLTNITIPEGVTSIGSFAFNYCSSLTSITIPKGVTYIGDYAFTSCFNLKTVYNYSALDIVKGATTHGSVAHYADNVYTA